jgi:hypothetical protein
MDTHHHILKAVAENANVITYAGAGGTIVFWGLHVSEIAAIISTFCAVCGLALQFYVALRRRRQQK